MLKQEFIIDNPLGLHARPAGVLVKVAQKFGCDVTLQHKKNHNAKSILAIMSANIKSGETITIICDGDDEAEAIKAVGEAIESGLGE